MQNIDAKHDSRPVAIWLMVGVAMLIIQVLLGGITRLTGSGLSITEWKPIIGTLPPLNKTDWNLAFEKYKQIAQFKLLNPHFTLQEFKHIYFWEWFHRLWARLIAVAFLIPFVIFIIRKKFQKDMIRPMVILFLLGALQGLAGWLMVKSGLEDPNRVYVTHYTLAIHFILAMILIGYTLWFALRLLVPPQQFIVSSSGKNFTLVLFVLLTVQLVYGSFMAGLKAAAMAPTWPGINGEFFPHTVFAIGDRNYPGLSFLTDNPLIVHFIHRMLAYLVMGLIICWWFSMRKKIQTTFQKTTANLPLLLVVLQVLLGIFSLYNVSTPKNFIWIAEAHQLTAMLLWLSILVQIFILRNSLTPETQGR